MNIPAFTLDIGSSAVLGPDSISNLLAWFNPSGISGSNGSTMSTWTDSGPNNYVPSQITGGVGPLVKTNALNGYTSANCAVHTGLRVTSGFGLSANNTWTCFGIVKFNAGGYYCAFRGDGNNTGVRLGRHTGSAGSFSYVLPNVIDNGSTESPALSVFHTIIAISNAGAESLYVDGAQYTLSGTNNMNSPTSEFVLCSDDAAHSLDGEVAELAWYDSALNSADRTTLFSYTSSKYGI